MTTKKLLANCKRCKSPVRNKLNHGRDICVVRPYRAPEPRVQDVFTCCGGKCID